MQVGKALLYMTYGVFIGLLVGAILWIATAPPRGEPVTLLPTSTPPAITVYVSGAVMQPGVYTLPAGSRIEAAIEAAGGFAPGAETSDVNLAAPVEDGQQIDIPGILMPTSVLTVGRVNINTATVAELDALPGIGPTIAQAIVDYRAEHGLFKSIQEIQQVPGIGPATFEKIRDYITVGP
ncbi:MAG: ComEA family DNA-binding protein [Anaerolineales bacterium]|nr:ComEA family DNA-binding protein [Anaerolineales bacterium]MCX7608980.1 ComEA family DNA-binding protein [Anaerolineales bacterium]